MTMFATLPTPARDDAAYPVDLKSVTVTLAALVLRTVEPDVVSEALGARFADAAALDNEPVVIDLSHLRNREAAVDFEALVAVLRRHALQPIAVRGGSRAQMAAATAIGLATVAVGAAPAVTASAPIPLDALPSSLSGARPESEPRVVLTEVVSEAKPVGSTIAGG
jgi:septum site-determining protein MinC